MTPSSTYHYPRFDFRCSEEQISNQPRRHPVVVVGAGPVGLTAALDLASHGIRVVVIDDNNTVSVGSRAICFAKRSLEIWDRLDCAARMVRKGVNWKLGRVFFRDEQVYTFDLLPEDGHKMPAMINLQQYYVEQYLVEECERSELIELRWKHKVIDLNRANDFVSFQVETPAGVFEMQADWLLACDGANSGIRRMVGASFTGKAFQDRFLIADVAMKAGFPPERRFWFAPPFHPGHSVLLHKECDDLWRVDFQLGWQVDPEEEKKHEKVIPRIRAMLGPDIDFEVLWVSIYQFACRRVDQFRHGRVLFAGDAAHQVSPFGARGANSGVQDADNLCWKLALVVQGMAPDALVDSYHEERAPAADDNIGHSTRATDFISPKSGASLNFRNAVLELARDEPFARALVNSGRLSTPTPYRHSPLNTLDESPFEGAMTPGSNCADAPIERGGRRAWLLEMLGDRFTVLVFGPLDADALSAFPSNMSLGELQVPVLCEGRDFRDPEGLLTHRYDARPETTYLVRPDQHVAGRWRAFDARKLDQAIERCLARVAPSSGSDSELVSDVSGERHGPEPSEQLKRTTNIADPDGFYQELMDSQRALSDEQAALMNAKLVLLLANQVGDRAVLRAAIERALPRLT